jgi:DNA-binding transcriptional LysR family regulator
MDFELRQLRHARALAEEGSFARAARTLHITQPALSRSIQELERRTGIKLFDRAQGRVEPTDLGSVFLAQARDLLGHAEALDREVATLRGAGTGRLVVGSGTFPTAIFVADALAAFLAHNPGVAVRVANDNWLGLIAGLRRREFDFVVAAPPAPEEATDLASVLLTPRQGRFLVRPGHPLMSRPGITLADVAAFPLVCTSRLNSAITAALLEARAGRGNAGPIPDMACESHEMMRHIVAATDHVLISVIAANARSIAAGDLAVLPIVDPRIASKFAVIRLRERTLPPIADALVDAVIAADRATSEAERLLLAGLLAAASARSPRAAKRRPEPAAAPR